MRTIRRSRKKQSAVRPRDCANWCFCAERGRSVRPLPSFAINSIRTQKDVKLCPIVEAICFPLFDGWVFQISQQYCYMHELLKNNCFLFPPISDHWVREERRPERMCKKSEDQPSTMPEEWGTKYLRPPMRRGHIKNSAAFFRTPIKAPWSIVGWVETIDQSGTECVKSLKE
jgi:hypothetical protein